MQIAPDFDGNPKNSGEIIFLWYIFKFLQVLVAVAVLYFIASRMIALVHIQKASMEPTLFFGETVLVNKLEYTFNRIKRGDIVTFHYPQNSRFDYIMRVIGLPGDRVVINDKQVLVNNLRLSESFNSSPPDYSGNWEVPEGNLFVLGDNRNPSEDLLMMGFLPMESVIGKTFEVCWPFTRIRSLSTPNIFASDILPPDLAAAEDLTPASNALNADQKFIIQQVQNSDSIILYAKQYSTTEDAIIRVNYSLNLPLREGDLIVIPFGFSNVSQMPYFQPYIVTESGLTIEALAIEQMVDLDEIIYFNGLLEGKNLNYGDWLIIPRKAPGS